MSFTYDESNLSTDKITQVRLATGQTEDDGGISDEVIQYMLSLNDDQVPPTNVDVLKNLLVQASQMYDKTTGNVSESQSQIYKQLKSLLTSAEQGLLAQAVPTGMHFGGLDALEFEERNLDNSVYQGFQNTNDGVDPFSDNFGLDVNDIGDDIIVHEEQQIFKVSISRFAFEISDWVLDTGNYTFTIAAATHGLTAPEVKVYNHKGELQTTTFTQVDDEIILTVTEVPDERFNGYVDLI